VKIGHNIGQSGEDHEVMPKIAGIIELWSLKGKRKDCKIMIPKITGTINL
jgi:hypothetical protein